jgi:hypothetical protein
MSEEAKETAEKLYGILEKLIADRPRGRTTPRKRSSGPHWKPCTTANRGAWDSRA